jgi:hypothetical protein
LKSLFEKIAEQGDWSLINPATVILVPRASSQLFVVFEGTEKRRLSPTN